MDLHFGGALARVGLALLCFSLAAPAAAQEAEAGESEARLHFRVGRAYHDSGRFIEAAHEFEEAYRLSPERPELLYNIFVAYRDGGQMRPAADALRNYLERVENVENRDQLGARLAAMERVIARQGTGSDEATEGGGATGSEGSEGTGAGTGAGTESTETTGGGAAGSSSSSSSSSSSTGTDTGGGGGLWVPGFIIGGVGAAAAIAGIITGVLALDARSSLEADYNCDTNGVCDAGFEGARDSGALLAGLTDGLIIGGAVVAVVGVVLAFVLADDGSSDTAHIDFGCSPDGCGATVRGSF